MILVKTYPTKELKNKIGSVLSVANREPVAITRNGHFSYVILSAEDWEHLGVDELYERRNTALLAQRVIKKSVEKKSWADLPMVGMWADRDDMKDVDAYVRNLRKPRF